jgi:hypothetical protein
MAKRDQLAMIERLGGLKIASAMGAGWGDARLALTVSAHGNTDQEELHD